ncbi:hypothetical protein QJQ45_022381 [Haematococcus lacustris]|nr:hypothetical protein QJQ45_022381 [Haematococcus lacustris]
MSGCLLRALSEDNGPHRRIRLPPMSDDGHSSVGRSSAPNECVGLTDSDAPLTQDGTQDDLSQLLNALPRINTPSLGVYSAPTGPAPALPQPQSGCLPDTRARAGASGAAPYVQTPAHSFPLAFPWVQGHAMSSNTQGFCSDDQSSKLPSGKDVRSASPYYPLSSPTTPVHQPGPSTDTHPTPQYSCPASREAVCRGSARSYRLAEPSPATQHWLASAVAAAGAQSEVWPSSCLAAAPADPCCSPMSASDACGTLADTFMASCCSPQPPRPTWPRLVLPLAHSSPHLNTHARAETHASGWAATAALSLSGRLSTASTELPASSQQAAARELSLGSQTGLTRQAASLALPIPISSPLLIQPQRGWELAGGQQDKYCHGDGELGAGYECGSWGSHCSVQSLSSFLTSPPSCY